MSTDYMNREDEECKARKHVVEDTVAHVRVQTPLYLVQYEDISTTISCKLSEGRLKSSFISHSLGI